MKIAVLGAGAWGFCLARHLASNNHTVLLWNRDSSVLDAIASESGHPKMGPFESLSNLILEPDFRLATTGVDLIIEAVSSQGIRPVLSELESTAPIVVTSKGIEQGSGLLLSEVAKQVVVGKNSVAVLSGPCIAKEMIQGYPASAVAAADDESVMHTVQKAFHGDRFRVYPNRDVNGVSFGGAMKNPIAIACGISDGLGFGQNTKAALMTRGLHEIRKLSQVKKCNKETLSGLAGMGDLCVTCLSTDSRNYQFGQKLAKNESAQQAKDEIGMVVEGAYTCSAALELSKKSGIPIPITEAVHAVIYEGKNPKDAVSLLLSRSVKEEML